jgi:hypothetical protein
VKKIVPATIGKGDYCEVNFSFVTYKPGIEAGAIGVQCHMDEVVLICKASNLTNDLAAESTIDNVTVSPRKKSKYAV